MIRSAVLRFSKYIKATRESSDLFVDSVVTCYSKKTTFIGIMLLLISFGVFASLTPDALINGDAALYTQQIASFDFSQRTVHLGYYLLGAAFTVLLPGSNDYTLNLMNCFFGALSISLLYLMTLTLCRKQTLAVVSSLFWATNFIFLRNALYAEVYMTGTFFLLLALQLWLLNKPVLTGLSFALSTLIAPSSIFAVPCLIILRARKKALLQLGATTFVILTVALLPHYNDYLFGDRGLLIAAGRPINIGSAILKECKEIAYGFFLYIPFLLAGIVQLVKEKRLHVFGVAIFGLWLFNFLLGERFGDVPTQLPTYALFCLLGGLGFHLFSTILRKVANRGRTNRLLVAFVVLTLVVGISSFRVFRLISKKNHELVGYRNTVLKVSKITSPDYLVVGKWGQGVLFHHYAFQELYTKHRTNTGWFTEHWINVGRLLKEAGGKRQQLESIEKWQEAIASGQEIWILQKSPSLFSDLRKEGYAIEPFRTIYRATKRIQPPTANQA